MENQNQFRNLYLEVIEDCCGPNEEDGKGGNLEGLNVDGNPGGGAKGLGVGVNWWLAAVCMREARFGGKF